MLEALAMISRACFWNSCLRILARSLCLVSLWAYPQVPTAVAEPCNTVLYVHSLLEHIDVTVMLDNEALCDINRRDLEIERIYATFVIFISAVLSYTVAATIPCLVTTYHIGLEENTKQMMLMMNAMSGI